MAEEEDIAETIYSQEDELSESVLDEEQTEDSETVESVSEETDTYVVGFDMQGYEFTSETRIDLSATDTATQVKSIKSKTYNGSAYTPAENGRLKLKQGTDYTLTYNNNINVGTSTVTIMGTGNYTGSIKARFIILPVGEPVTGIYSCEGALSGCVPIVKGGNVVWYYTNNSEPKFCSINIEEVRKQAQ